MGIAERIKNLIHEKSAAVVTVLGITGLLLILISSLIPDKIEKSEIITETVKENYCLETEKRLEEFLRSIEGVGDVRVYISLGRDERYVYASEGRKSKSENKTEEEEKYVIIGGSEKTALVETVEAPEITGAVIACEGCESASVQERIYKAVSAALGIPTGKIYVTQLK